MRFSPKQVPATSSLWPSKPPQNMANGAAASTCQLKSGVVRRRETTDSVVAAAINTGMQSDWLFAPQSTGMQVKGYWPECRWRLRWLNCTCSLVAVIMSTMWKRASKDLVFLLKLGGVAYAFNHLVARASLVRTLLECTCPCIICSYQLLVDLHGATFWFHQPLPTCMWSLIPVHCRVLSARARQCSPHSKATVKLSSTTVSPPDLSH